MSVYWYERIEKKNEKKNENENENEKKMREDKEKDDENEEIERLDSMIKDGIKVKGELMEVKGELMEVKEKIITRKDVFEKASAVRNACKALDHLNKRYKFKHFANNYAKAHIVS